jgi:hypothetical protein
VFRERFFDIRPIGTRPLGRIQASADTGEMFPGAARLSLSGVVRCLYCSCAINGVHAFELVSLVGRVDAHHNFWLALQPEGSTEHPFPT